MTPNWLRDSVRRGKALPFEAYVALQDLREETISNCPTCQKDPCECADSDAGYESGAESMYPSPPVSTRSTGRSAGLLFFVNRAGLLVCSSACPFCPGVLLLSDGVTARSCDCGTGSCFGADMPRGGGWSNN